MNIKKILKWIWLSFQPWQFITIIFIEQNVDQFIDPQKCQNRGLHSWEPHWGGLKQRHTFSCIFGGMAGLAKFFGGISPNIWRDDGIRHPLQAIPFTTSLSIPVHFCLTVWPKSPKMVLNYKSQMWHHVMLIRKTKYGYIWAILYFLRTYRFETNLYLLCKLLRVEENRGMREQCSHENFPSNKNIFLLEIDPA